MRVCGLQEDKTLRQYLAVLFFGTWFGGLAYVSYLDTTYGGPVHGKGLCVASFAPAVQPAR